MGLDASSIIGIGTSLTSAGASFVQAAQQNRAALKAKAEAEKAFTEAKKNLQVNFYEQLGIQREAYEREREAMLVAGAQAIQSGVESERGAAATAGRVQMAQQEGQREIAGAMAKELAGLQAATAEEEARLATQRASLDLAQAQGAQAAATQSAEAQAAAIQGGFSGLMSAGQQYIQGKELYKKTQGTKEYERLSEEYKKAVKDGNIGSKFKDAKGNILSFEEAMSKLTGYGEDLSSVSTMTPLKAQQYLIERPDILKSISGNIFSRESSYIPAQAPKSPLQMQLPSNVAQIQIKPPTF